MNGKENIGDMTVEQLNNGQRIMDKIKKLQEFQKALHAPYINFIRACDYPGDREADRIIIIDSDSELYKMIDCYIDTQIKKMQKEFDSI